MSGSAPPLANNPAASAEVTAHYCRLFRDYCLAANAVHLADRTVYGEPLWEWSGPHGFVACTQPPLVRFLAAPRLPPELAQHLKEEEEEGQEAEQGLEAQLGQQS